MMRTTLWRTTAALAGLVTIYGLAVGVGIWTRNSDERRKPEVVALPSHTVAKVTALGFDNVVADFYMLRAIQYFGNSDNGRDNYKYLFPLVDLVSELDPKWPEPLLWGGIAVQRNLGRETWINTAESTRLLQKGAERFPGEWRFQVYTAYNLSTFHHDYLAAAKVLEKAVGHPEAPDWIPSLVTRLYSSAGDLETAQAFAAVMAGESEDPTIAELMNQRLIDIETEKRLRRLEHAVEEFKQREGRLPTRLEELVSAGIVTRLPQEPRDGDWSITEAGEVKSSAMPRRLLIEDYTQTLRKPISEENEKETP